MSPAPDKPTEVEDYRQTSDFQRRIAVSRGLVRWHSYLALLWGLLCAWLGITYGVIIALVAAVAFTLSAYLFSRQSHDAARALWFVFYTGCMFVADSVMGAESKINSTLIVSMTVPFLMYSWVHELRYIVVFVLTSMLAWVATIVNDHHTLPILQASAHDAATFIAIGADLTIFISSILVVYIFSREIRAYEQSLLDAVKRAEDSARTKAEFLSNMSHEIRTPMNAIIGMSHLALRSGLDARQFNFVSKAKNAAENLLVIINDILDFSKIDAGKLDMESHPFELSAVMSDVRQLIALKAEAKQVAIVVQQPAEVPNHLVGDALRLGQIMTNLVDNAVKFSEPGGSVTIEVELGKLEHDQATLHFMISDQGIGIGTDTRGRLFQSFSQADGSTTRKFGGTGLGLVIAKRLTEMMHGTIWFDSTKGDGSTFHFTVCLPYLANGVPEAEPDEATEQTQAALRHLRNACILVVEDNPINLELVIELLVAEGIKVATAGNGQEALDLLNKQHFDGVLMDCQMPVLDGYEATRRIRQQDQWRELPVIALTANTMQGDREKVLEAGMNDHIAKPIDPAQLFITMAKWIHLPDKR